jgi:hypothetical protein
MSLTVVSTSVALKPRRFPISFSMRRRRRAELTSTSSRDPIDAQCAQRGVFPVFVLPIAGFEPVQARSNENTSRIVDLVRDVRLAVQHREGSLRPVDVTDFFS